MSDYALPYQPPVVRRYPNLVQMAHDLGMLMPPMAAGTSQLSPAPAPSPGGGVHGNTGSGGPTVNGGGSAPTGGGSGVAGVPSSGGPTGRLAGEQLPFTGYAAGAIGAAGAALAGAGAALRRALRRGERRS
jgi:hypothetical protein